MSWNDSVLLPGLILELAGVLVLVSGVLTGTSLVMMLGAGIVCIAVVVLVIRILREARRAGTPGPAVSGRPDAVPGTPADPTILYEDRLVSISADAITFHHYAFPFFSSDRQVLFTDIHRIDAKKPDVLAGKWRIAGSGNLRIWFPLDWGRPSRDRIFHALLKTGGMNIGFTVEDSSRVISLLKEKGITVAETGE